MIGLTVAFMQRANLVVLQPKGIIGKEQKQLILQSVLLMALVIIPVYFLSFFIAWKYRASNKKVKFQPDWDSHRGLEAVWWGIPIILITILSVMAWNSSHQLDPFRPIDSPKKALSIQVIALQWRWLFIYPEQNIASLSYAYIPTDQPIDFNITSDAPMNSFWVPQLGGQIYAMSGMTTHLNLQADEPGIYQGSSANISGRGFAGMTFQVQAGSDIAFQQWVGQVRAASNNLSFESYKQLAEPSEDRSVVYFSSVQKGLYDSIVFKYLAPKDRQVTPENSTHMSGMEDEL